MSTPAETVLSLARGVWAAHCASTHPFDITAGESATWYAAVVAEFREHIGDPDWSLETERDKISALVGQPRPHYMAHVLHWWRKRARQMAAVNRAEMRIYLMKKCIASAMATYYADTYCGKDIESVYKIVAEMERASSYDSTTIPLPDGSVAVIPSETVAQLTAAHAARQVV